MTQRLPRRLRDQLGREVTLTTERWRHIVAAHPELKPYLADAGPSRWLKVVVVFGRSDRGRIITAFSRRRKP